MPSFAFGDSVQPRSKNWLRVAIGGLVAALCLLVAAVAPAVAPAAEPSAAKASTSRASRDEAIQSIPFDKLTREMRSQVATIVNSPSIYRRLPAQLIDCDPDLYQFLIGHPEIVVEMWRAMGITNMTLDRVGQNRFRAADGQGTVGTAEYAFRNDDTCIIYSEGTYDGPMFPTKLRGHCVMILKTAQFREPNGRQYVAARIDAFLHIENAGVELVAKTLQPLLGKTADKNFEETSSFVSTLSHTAESNPDGVGRLAQRLKRLDPQTRQQFTEVASHVSENAAAAATAVAAARKR